MGLYVEEMKKRKKELETGIILARKFLNKAPEGTVRVAINVSGAAQFYHITKETGKSGRYIRKKNQALTAELIQKEYSRLFIWEAEEELRNIDHFLEHMNYIAAEDIPGKLHKNKRPYLKPYIPDEKMLTEIWRNKSYNISTYKPEEKVYPTKNGEMVRSKSEAMLADMYYELGIPYRYECELVLNNGKKKYPDFTLLDVKGRKIVYHEHMGLMDDEKYRNKNLNKINEYRKSGVFVGKNLILTFEADKCPMNINDIRASIKEMFL